MDLFFREFGSGQPLIILHGLFGQSDNWVTLGRRLAEQFHVFIPDQRNHGQSPHAPVHSFPAMAEDLVLFIEQHHIVDPILIGHSMGGKVAMMHTLENPDKVQKLVIVDISPRQYPERSIHTQVLSQMLSLNLDAYSTRTEIGKLLSERIPDVRIRTFILKNLYYQAQGKLKWRLNLDVINQSMDLLFDGIPATGIFEGPTLFVRGGQSDYILDEDIPLIIHLFPNAVLKTIPGASHWVHADAPEELCLLLSRFLDKECYYPLIQGNL